MAKQLSRDEWRARRRKYRRVVADLTPDENARWRERLQQLGQASAERLRRLIQIDINHRSADPQAS